MSHNIFFVIKHPIAVFVGHCIPCQLIENEVLVVFVTELELELVKYPDVDGVSLIEILEVEEVEEVWDGEFVEESEGLLDSLTDELCEGDDVKDKVKLEEAEL